MRVALPRPGTQPSRAADPSTGTVVVVKLPNDTMVHHPKMLNSLRSRIVFLITAAALLSMSSKAFVPLERCQQTRQIRVRPQPTSLSSVSLQLSPLVGGPKWLRVHVKVLLVDSSDTVHFWDFVPLNATSPATLASLLRFRSVPAEIRYQKKQSSGASKVMLSGNAVLSKNRDLVVSRVNEDFCPSYPMDLHLIWNNCWNFAFDLVAYLNDLELEEQ